MKPASKIAAAAAILASAGLVSISAPRIFRDLAPSPPAATPSTRVRRGDVNFTISAKGALQGGNSRMLTAPMVGSQSLVITELRQSGELVKQGDVVARFDITEESYKLREAESDLAEAEAQVVQAENEAAAKEEELNHELIKARGDLKDAQFEAERNPLVAAITARQNDLAVAGASDRLAKLERDYPARKEAARASIAIQNAAREKAKMLAETARKNIEMMTLKAPADGYINVERNTNTNFFFSGMTLPLFQVGDQIRPGMAAAQIPDMSSWEVGAKIAEADRGHLSVSQPAEIRVIALPGRVFTGRVKDLGGTTGPPWERRFECKLSLDDPVPELRPGMSARLVVATEKMSGVLWLPAQALFESDGRNFVYLKSGSGFQSRDVKLVRRSESQVVIEGLNEGNEVALASPDQSQPGKSGGPGAAKAVAK